MSEAYMASFLMARMFERMTSGRFRLMCTLVERSARATQRGGSRSRKRTKAKTESSRFFLLFTRGYRLSRIAKDLAFFAASSTKTSRCTAFLQFAGVTRCSFSASTRK